MSSYDDPELIYISDPTSTTATNQDPAYIQHVTMPKPTLDSTRMAQIYKTSFLQVVQIIPALGCFVSAVPHHDISDSQNLSSKICI